jgi:hypothetical protein
MTEKKKTEGQSTEHAIVRQDGPQSLTPAEMLSIAVRQDAPVEKIEKLMDLQQRWEANEARKAFESAMVKFSAAVPTIAKTRQGHNSKYAGLPETVEQVQALMSECQLSRRWEDREPKRPGNIRIRAVVSHVMGHSVSFELEAGPDIGPGRNDIQAVASTITYLRRITLFAALGLVAADEIDDDGAGGKKTEPPKPQSPTDPEVETKRAFLELCRAKAGVALTGKQVAGIFARVAEIIGESSAAERLAYVQRLDVLLYPDGTLKTPDSIPDEIPSAFEPDETPAAAESSQGLNEGTDPLRTDPQPPLYQCDKCLATYLVRPAKDRCLSKGCQGTVRPRT